MKRKSKLIKCWGLISLFSVIFSMIMTGIFTVLNGDEYAPGHYTASLSDVFPWPIFLFGGIASFIILVIYCKYCKEPLQQQKPAEIILSDNGKLKAEIYQKLENSFYVQYYRMENAGGWAYIPKATSIYGSLEDAVKKSNEKFKRLDNSDESKYR